MSEGLDRLLAWIQTWSRRQMITAALSAPVTALAGMAVGKGMQSHWWAFLCPLAGIWLAAGLALGALAWAVGKHLEPQEVGGGVAGLEESERPDE